MLRVCLCIFTLRTSSVFRPCIRLSTFFAKLVSQNEIDFTLVQINRKIYTLMCLMNLSF